MKELLELFKGIELFSGLPEDELVPFAERFGPVSFDKGSHVFREGETADKMYIVVKGELVVLKGMEGGERELARLMEGECFGEMALISMEKRFASVEAITDVECLEISEQDFANLVKEDHRFDQSVMRVLTDRLRVSEDLASQNIMNAYHTLIFSLATLAENRDPETGAHLNRVRNYCYCLSNLLSELPAYRDKITPPFIKTIYIVSPLHDIGKVGIKDDVLLKPGRLTKEEFEVMKTHSAIGAETIKKVVDSCPHFTFQMAYSVIRYHHERFDGKGYPEGLAGEDIPLEARIMALADVYDALLSKRVYKESFDYEKSVAIIAEGSGTQFDPDIAQVMLDNIDEFVTIHKRNVD